MAVTELPQLNSPEVQQPAEDSAAADNDKKGRWDVNDEGDMVWIEESGVSRCDLHRPSGTWVT